VVYLHRTVNYEHYRLPANLPDGTFAIRITLANDKEGFAIVKGEPTSVETWKGKAVSPPVAFSVNKGVIQLAPELQPPQDMEFKAAYDGSVQKYMLLLPAGVDPSRPHDLVIALHGHGADRQQYASDPRGECKGARDVAGRHGMIFVSPDYRAPASWMGPAAEADMVQLIGELKRQYKVGKVYLVGGSMGGAAVLTFTALHPELVDGVSSQNGLANLLEYKVDFVYVVGIQSAMKDSFGGRADETPEQFKKRDPDAYRKRSAESHADKFTMPIAFTVGEKDAIVPPQSVLRLAQAVKKHNQRVLVIDRPEEGHQTSYEDTVTAIEFVIKP
jgi:dipeptidyl aminopeptidase/acylaminoacyl peptidase